MLSPIKQREAEAVFDSVLRLVERYGKHQPFEIGDRMRLLIIPNVTVECTTITVRNLNTDSTVMIAAHERGQQDFPPSFISYAPGFWKSIVSHAADQLEKGRI